MPRKEHNIGRQRSHRNYYAINGLLTARGRKMRDLRLGNGEATQVQADIDAIDRVLVNVFDFQDDIEAVTRDFKRNAVLKRGELFRMVCDVLREADRPLTTREIAEVLADRKGLVLHTGKRTKEFIIRVRHACRKLPEGSKTVNADGVQVWDLIL